MRNDPNTLSQRIWPDMDQRTEAWFRARAGRPTASQFSRIITPDGKDSTGWANYATELMVEAICPHLIEGSFYGNDHTDRGNRLEPHAIRWAEDSLGYKINEVGFITCDNELFGCSPDGLVTNSDGSIIAGIEVKSPEEKKHARHVLVGKLPAEHRQQVHGSMVVTGLRHWYFVSYSEFLEPFICLVEWDSYTDKVSNALSRFAIYYQQRVKDDASKLRRKQ